MLIFLIFLLYKKDSWSFIPVSLNGKDLGMQDHHSTAVDAMLETLTSSRSSSFSFVTIMPIFLP